MPDLRSAIRSAIDARGLSIAEAARLSGVPRPNLSPYLAGTKELRSDSIERLLETLGLRIVAARPAKP